MLRRIERRLQVRALPNLTEYAELLEKDAAGNKVLLKGMLNGVTNLLRNREAFDSLAQTVLSHLLYAKDANEQIRGWVAACSTGAEA